MMQYLQRNSTAIFFTLFFIFATLSGFSQTTYTWFGGSGEWGSASNWSPNGVPGAADTAVINLGTVALNGNAVVGGLKLNNGVFGGGGTLAAAGRVFWSNGRMEGSGTLQVSPGAIMEITGNAAKDLNQYAILNEGTLRCTGTGALRLSNAAQIINQAGASCIFLTDMQVDSLAAGGGQFSNAGTLAKNGGSGAAALNIAFNNTGSVSVSSGTLRLRRSSASINATYAVTAGNVLQFSEGVHTLENVSFGGGGTLEVTGATLLLSGPGLSITPGNTLAISGSAAVLAGSGSLSVLGTLNWSRGRIAGDGAFTLGGVMNLSGSSAKTLETRVLINSGTINWSDSGELRLRSNAEILNQAGAIFDMQSNAELEFAAPDGGALTNLGNLVKSAGAGISVIDVIFNNSGNVALDSGTVELRRNSSDTGGMIAIAAGSTLRLDEGTHDFNAASSVSGPGEVSVSDGTTNFGGSFNATGSLTIVGGNMNFSGNYLSGSAITLNSGRLAVLSPVTASGLTQTGGTLEIGASLALNGDLNWSGGTLAGTAAPSISGAIHIHGTLNKLLDGVALTNHSLATWSDAGELRLKNGAQFINAAGATFSIRGNALLNYISPGGGTLVNHGTVAKTAGSGVTVIGVDFTNNAAVTADSGTVRFTRASASQNAVFAAQPGSLLQFSSGTHTLNGVSFNAGTVEVTAAALNAAGAGLTVSSSATLQMADLNSTLAGDGAINIQGTLNWRRGTISGNGSLAINGILNIYSEYAKTLDARPLDNFGSINWADTGEFRLLNQAALKNQGSGVFNITGNAKLAFATPGGGSLVNSGTILKSGSSGQSTIDVEVQNSGTVNLASGTLQLGRGSLTESGSFAIAAGAKLRCSAGSHVFGPGASVSGAGGLTFSGGNSAFSGVYSLTGSLKLSGGALTLNSDISLPQLEVSGGVLAGSGAVTVNTLFNWSGGKISGAGSLLLNGSTQISGGGAKELDGRALANAGSAAWSGTGNILLQNGAALLNQAGAVLDIRNDAWIDSTAGGGGTFSNMGSILKTAGTGAAVIDVPFTHQGTLNVSSGILRITRNSSCSGNIQTAANSEVQFSLGAHVFDGISLGGGGTVRFSNVPVLVNGAGLVVDSGVSLAMSGLAGALGGNGDVTVNGKFNWDRGTISGGGDFRVNGALNITGSSGSVLDGRTIELYGTAGWSGTGDLRLRNFANLQIQPGATFTIQNNAQVAYLTPNGGSINNAGAVRKASAGLSSINVSFQNEGLLEVQAGTLKFGLGLTNAQSGTIRGNGALDVSSAVSFNNHGIFAPGGPASPGTFTVTGNYPQSASGRLNIKLGGLAPGSGYDRLAVSGAAQLDGILNLALANNFAPSPGDQFPVVTYASRSGQFSAINSAGISNHATFDHAYTPNALVLTVTSFSNQPPVALGENAFTDEDLPVSLNLLLNDSDPDGDTLTIGAIFPAANGAAAREGDSLAVYTPAENFFGQDSFRYVVIDGFGGSDTATVLITVLPVNDPPVLSNLPPALICISGDTLWLGLDTLATDVDDPIGSLAWSVEILAGPGISDSIQVILDPLANLLQIIPHPQFTAQDLPVLFSVCDTSNACDQDTVLLSVLPGNQPPLISGLPATLRFAADTTASLDLWEYVYDPETPDSLLSFEFSVSNDSLLYDFNSASGVLTLAAAPGYSGQAQLHIRVIDEGNAAAADSILAIVDPVVGIGDPAAGNIPKTFAVAQNYPNPFNPETAISYQLAAASEVELAIYNVLGQKVRTLVQARQPAGRYEVKWDGRSDAGVSVASGVYIYRFTAGPYQKVMKMVLLR